MSVDASQRKVELAQEQPFRLGAAEVRPATLEVRGPQGVSVLQPRVMQVLVALARQSGEVVSREALNEAAWGGRIVSEAAMNRCIVQLRKLSDHQGGFVIETVARVGYRLSPADQVPKGDVGAARRRGPILAALILLVAVAASALGVWLLGRQRPPPPVSMAVAAFEVVGADPVGRAVAQAAPGELLAALNESHVDARPAGERSWRRAYRIDGVVRTQGNELRLRVRLRPPRSDETLWTVEFAAPRDRAQDLATNAAWRTTAVATLIAELARSGERLDRPGVLSSYLQVRDSTHKPNPAALEDTIRRDPAFAWGRLSRAVLLLERAYAAPGAEFQAQRDAVRAEATAATRLNPRVPGNVVLATTEPAARWAERERLLRQAQAVSPGVMADDFLARLLRATGQQQEAFGLLERHSPGERHWMGTAASWPLTAYMAWSPRQGLAEARMSLRTRPDDLMVRYTHLFIAALALPPAEARQVLADPSRRPDVPSAAVIAYDAFLAARESGQAEARQAAASRISEAARLRALDLGVATALLSSLGATDEAFALWARFAASERASRLPIDNFTTYLFTPDARAMRADPRFGPLVERLGIADYWRRTGRRPDFCRDEPAPICQTLAPGRQPTSSQPSGRDARETPVSTTRAPPARSTKVSVPA